MIACLNVKIFVLAAKIKRVCETELGIVSQCCQPRQVRRLNNQYLENVALKINVKVCSLLDCFLSYYLSRIQQVSFCSCMFNQVGGTNAVLEQAVQKQIPFLTDLPTIIFGADVTHPQPGEDSSPSIAAVCSGSVNDFVVDVYVNSLSLA